MSWTLDPNADGYEIEQVDDSGCGRSTSQRQPVTRCDLWFTVTTAGSQTTSYVVMNLTSGATFVHRGRSFRGPRSSREYGPCSFVETTTCPGGQCPTAEPTPTPTPIPTPTPTATPTHTPTPTPPDAPVLTGSRLNGAISLDWNDVSNADDYRLEQCLTPAGVAGCHTYPWPVVPRPDETTSNAEITNARPDRDYYFVVRAYRGTNSSVRSNRLMVPAPPPMPVPPTATPTPTPTPLPLPTLDILFLETNPRIVPQSITHAQWVVLHQNDIRIEANGQNLGDYEFRLKTNAATTGLYWATAGHTCVSAGSTDTGWFRLNVTGSTGTEDFTMIRCALGDKSGAVMEIEARYKGGAAVTALTPNIQQGWHRDSRRATYYFDIASFTSRGTSATVLGDSVQAASDAWNAVRPFFSPASGSNANVIIRATSDAGADCNNPNALACVRLGRNSHHPHYGDRPLWVATPPSPTTTWTTIRTLAQGSTGVASYHYLPVVMAHEFGHVAGLGHLRTGYGVMGASYSPYHLGTTPGPDDEYGFGEVNEPH